MVLHKFIKEIHVNRALFKTGCDITLFYTDDRDDFSALPNLSTGFMNYIAGSMIDMTGLQVTAMFLLVQ